MCLSFKWFLSPFLIFRFPPFRSLATVCGKIKVSALWPFFSRMSEYAYDKFRKVSSAYSVRFFSEKQSNALISQMDIGWQKLMFAFTAKCPRRNLDAVVNRKIKAAPRVSVLVTGHLPPDICHQTPAPPRKLPLRTSVLQLGIGFGLSVRRLW